MSINSQLYNALSPFGIPIEEGWYDGKSTKWISIIEAYDHGDVFGDNNPMKTVVDLQIHLFLPVRENYISLKRKVRNAIFNAGFTYPEVTMSTEDDTEYRHIIFECQNTEEVSLIESEV